MLSALDATGLQWVHSPRTVVRPVEEPHPVEDALLQWVHSPRTVVRSVRIADPHRAANASMGPQSENCG